MSLQVSAPLRGDETLASCAGQAEVPAPDAVALTSSPQLTSDVPDIVRDDGDRLSALPMMPRQPTGFPVGIIGYLGSLAIVATATIGVFFGIGLLSLINPREEITQGITGSSRSDLLQPVASISRPFDSSSFSEEKAPSAQPEPELSRSAAMAALPPAPPARLPDPPPGAASDPGREMPLQAGLATPPTLMAGSLAGAPQNPSSEGEMPVSEAPDPPSVEPSAVTAGSSEPVSHSLAAVPQPPPLVLSAAEIGELLARGDAFLRMGDLTSARLFYERAADAGNGQGAMRMGATFDPAFLGQAGSRSVQGDPVKARAWYRKALDLSIVEIERQSGTVDKR
jgi:hypothetical protein